jgi:hypothetical protein
MEPVAIDWQRVLPVIVSILVIILVALLRQHSRLLAAITATMPINVPLALWIVYAAEEGEPAAMVNFSEGLLIGILPSLVFLVVIWLALRAGWSLIPVIAVGYVAWGVGLGVIFVVRNLSGS